MPRPDAPEAAFLDLVTHDLRAPLAAVRTMVSVLADGHAGELPPTQADLVRRIAWRLACLHELVDDLIDLAGVRAGRDIGDGADACATARAACDRLAGDTTAGAPGIALSAPEGRIAVRMAAADLDVVLHHLLDNAAKYGSGLGVRVAVERVAGEARITVADRGIGVADEARPRLFEPFFRAPNALAAAPGSGLGLLTVKEAVQRCGGTVEIESREGAGFTVVVRLPLV
jgi:signal transduction histidine kinase